MRLSHLFLTFVGCLLVSTLVIAQEDVSSLVSEIPANVIGGGGLFPNFRKNNVNINKEIEITAKDIIVNVGKVKVEIEKNQQQEAEQEQEYGSGKVSGADNAEEEDGSSLVPRANINKEIEIQAKDIIVNIAKVKIDIEKNNQQRQRPYPDHSIGYPTHKPIIKKPVSIGKPPKKSSTVYDDTTTPIDSTDEVPSAEDTSTDLTEFEDFTPSAEPEADETVLGENSTAAAVTVQGGEQFGKDGVLILTGPQIFSVTFKIIKKKVIKIIKEDGLVGNEFGINGVDGSLGLDGFNQFPVNQAVTFIIRGRGFVPGGNLFFNDISEVVDGTSRGGLFDFLEPRVFLGAIPLKVVRFTDTIILARFLDFEDQRRFEAGTLLARVKVLHVDLRQQEKKKHGPEDGFGILGGEDGIRTEVVSVGGLVLPALGAIGGSIPSGPILGVVDGIGIDGKNNKKEDGVGVNSLLGLFAGLQFDTAVLSVQFSTQDAIKIRGSVNTLFTDGSLFPEDL